MIPPLSRNWLHETRFIMIINIQDKISLGVLFDRSLLTTNVLVSLSAFLSWMDYCELKTCSRGETSQMLLFIHSGRAVGAVPLNG